MCQAESITVKKSGKSGRKKFTVIYYGICTTCNHAGECENARNSSNPVWDCEEFDNYQEPESVAMHRDIPAEQSTFGHEYGDYKGLCMNCEKRATCDLARTEGGIWHCEEYE